MNEQQLDEILREYHDSREALVEAEDKIVAGMLTPSVSPKDVSSSVVRIAVREKHPDLVSRHHEAAIVYEQVLVQLRRREVEAHEWMIQFRKIGMKS